MGQPCALFSGRLCRGGREVREIGLGLWMGGEMVRKGEGGGLFVENEGIDIFVGCLLCFWDYENEECLRHRMPSKAIDAFQKSARYSLQLDIL